MKVRLDKPHDYIQFPTDVSKLGEKQRRDLWISRKTGSKVTDDFEEQDDEFDSSEYEHLLEQSN